MIDLRSANPIDSANFTRCMVAQMRGARAAIFALWTNAFPHFACHAILLLARDLARIDPEHTARFLRGTADYCLAMSDETATEAVHLAEETAGSLRQIEIFAAAPVVSRA
jgi:hypothetical protein